MAIARSGAVFVWGPNADPHPEEVPNDQAVPKVLDFYTAQHVAELPPAQSAASIVGVSAIVLADGGALRLLTRHYQSNVRAPNGRAGWFVHAISGAGGFTQVVATLGEFFALSGAGTVWRFRAEIVDLDGGLEATAPVQVAGLADVAQLSAGDGHLLARRSDGTVLAMGANEFGQLGDGTTGRQEIPVVVPGLTGITDIAAGGSHSLALHSNGTMLAWGRGGEGQLGNGQMADARSPVQVVSPNGNPVSGIIALAAGSNHSLAHDVGASVWSWGSASRGQLGDGQTVGRAFAERLDGLMADRISAARHSSYTVVFAAGTVRAWGDNDNGRLGDGTVEQRNTPMRALGLGRIEGTDCREVEPPRSATTVFEDTEFADSDWQVTVIANDGSPTQTAASAPSGGNPGAYRHMTHNTGQGPSSLFVYHFNRNAVYSPATLGAITGIDFREDRRVFGESFDPNAAVGATFALMQGDRIFIETTTATAAFSNLQWTTTELAAELRNFGQMAGPPCPEGGRCPDFTAAGAPITFGYGRGQGALFGQSFFTTQGIDNWRVTVRSVR